MKVSLGRSLLLVLFILNSCTEVKKTENKKENTNPCIEPSFYINNFKDTTITLECFNLNELPLKDKNQFVYGYHYFCDQKNAETGGPFEVFANGLVKINNKIEILEPFMYYGSDIYFINENYIIRAFFGSQKSKKNNSKIKITVFDLKRNLQSTSTFYFSWFCEA